MSPIPASLRWDAGSCPTEDSLQAVRSAATRRRAARRRTAAMSGLAATVSAVALVMASLPSGTSASLQPTTDVPSVEATGDVGDELTAAPPADDATGSELVGRGWAPAGPADRMKTPDDVYGPVPNEPGPASVLTGGTEPPGTEPPGTERAVKVVLTGAGNTSAHLVLPQPMTFNLEFPAADVDREARYAGFYLRSANGSVAAGAVFVRSTDGEALDWTMLHNPADQKSVTVPAGSYVAYLLGEGPTQVSLQASGRGYPPRLEVGTAAPVSVTFDEGVREVDQASVEFRRPLAAGRDSVVLLFGRHISSDPYAGSSEIVACLPRSGAACSTDDPSDRRVRDFPRPGAGATYYLGAQLLVLPGDDVFQVARDVLVRFANSGGLPKKDGRVAFFSLVLPV